jgi:GT2 family glycosyltransferase
MPSVFAIVVTYNGERWLQDCFNSLRKSSVPVHTIVVDNGSTDNTIKILQDQYPEVELIISKENLGFGRANNIGIEKALQQNAEYILLLNQDAWLINSTDLEELIKLHKNHPEVGILSPMHVNREISELDHNFSRYISDPNFPEIISDIYLNKTKEIYEVEFVNAAFWLLSFACVKKVGLFDSLFFHYGEDVNYVQRVRFHNFKIGVCPKVKGVHDRMGRKGVPEKFMGMEKEKRSLLFKLANVNNKNYKKEIIKMQWKILFSILWKFITLKFDELKIQLRALVYLNSHKRAILRSQRKNRATYIDNGTGSVLR